MELYQKLQANAVTKEDYIKASDYLIELANNENVDAMCELGLCYRYETTVLRYDVDLAKYWLEIVAKKEHPIAIYEYGWMLSSPKLLRKAFETNESFVLGDMYRYGIHVEENESLSIEYYSKAGCFRAFNALGDTHYKDLSKSFEYYLKSANMGYSVAQNNIGCYYEKGKGIKKNLTKAYNWYKKSANQNDESAMHKLKKETFNNFDRHENARNASLCLIAIRKFKKSLLLNDIPMDVIKIIAKEIWNTRNDEEWQLFHM